MRQAINGTTHGIKWTSQSQLTDLDFADDISLLAETRGTLQDMTTNLETEAGHVGLRISANKTKVMQVGEVESLLAGRTLMMWTVLPTLAVFWRAM